MPIREWRIEPSMGTMDDVDPLERKPYEHETVVIDPLERDKVGFAIGRKDPVP